LLKFPETLIYRRNVRVLYEITVGNPFSMTTMWPKVEFVHLPRMRRHYRRKSHRKRDRIFIEKLVRSIYIWRQISKPEVEIRLKLRMRS